MASKMVRKRAMRQYIFGEVPTSVEDTLVVADAFVIQDANVSIDITHTFIGDVTIDITSPAGNTVRLHDEGGLSADQILVSFDDQGVTNGSDLYECDCAMQPSGPGELFDFNGEPSEGLWSLAVST